MALPTMASRPWSAGRDFQKARIKHRSWEENCRRQWDQTSTFFKREDIKAKKIQKWTSDEFYRRSYDSQKDEEEKDRKSLRLKERRVQLAAMLLEENKLYETELKELSPRTNRELLEDMRERVEGLQSAREEKRRQLADEKLLDHWHQNNSEIRQVESQLHKDHVVSSWKDQVEDRQQRLDTARTEADEYTRMMEEQRKAAEETERAAEKQRVLQRKDLKSILQRQMQELREKEEEAAMLKAKQDEIMMERRQIEVIEENRRRLETNRRKQDFGHVLLRQHKYKMQRRARKVREELEEDYKLLAVLAAKDAELDAVQTARREKAVADAQWMKEVIEEQLKLERAREAELELLFEEEAARVWDRREREWEKEKRAREKLMAEVLATRKEQMDRKLLELRQKQEESVQLREELLQDMELANQLSQREQKKTQHDQLARKQELQLQLSARQQETQIAEEEEHEAQETARKEAVQYEDLLRQKTERLQIQGFKQKDFRRKNAWF